MTEHSSAYERLKVMARDNDKIDASVMHFLSSVFEFPHPDETLVAMLMTVDPNSATNWKKYALVGPRTGDIISVFATPVQIIELLKLPDVWHLTR